MIGWLILGVAALGLLGLGVVGFWGSVSSIEPIWRFVPVEAEGELVSSYSTLIRCNYVGSWSGGYGESCYRRYATISYTYTYEGEAMDGSFKQSFRFKGDKELPVWVEETYGPGKLFTVYVDSKQPDVSLPTRSISLVDQIAVPILSLGWIALVVYGAYRMITDPVGATKKQR